MSVILWVIFEFCLTVAYYLESNLQGVTSPLLYFPVSLPVPPHAVASTKCLAGYGSLHFLFSWTRQGGDLVLLLARWSLEA